jgi:hypothetical protein
MSAQAVMKSKFLNFITVCLATSIFLVPSQKAFGFDAEPQSTKKPTRLLVKDIKSTLVADRQGTHNQEAVPEGKADQTRQIHQAHPVTGASEITDSNQSNSVDQTASVTNTSNTIGGVVVTFLFISYILVGLQYRKHRAHRAAVLLKQIETLERIWKINPQQR